jgi:pimeloyl-ACP methyl ester carboxylesterase
MKWIIRYYKAYFRITFTFAPNFAAKKAIQIFSTPINHKLRDREIAVMAKAKSQILQIEGYDIVVYQWGNGNKKALLVHGWEGNGGSLGGIANLLVENGYTVYSFDGPAHGKSSGKHTNVIAFSGIVAELIKQYEIYDLIATHSFGSATTTYALAGKPEIKIDKVIFLTSPNKLRNVMKEFGAVLAFRQRDLEHMFMAIQHTYGVSVDSLNIEDLTLKTSVKSFFVIHDVKDRIIPLSYSEEIVAKNSKATLIKLEGTGHYRMLWDEKTLNAIQKILSE